MSSIGRESKPVEDVLTVEDGTVSTTSVDAVTTSVTFTDTYEPDAVNVSASFANSQTRRAANDGAGGITSLNTDANGNVTGCTVRHKSGYSGETYTTRWTVMGVPI